MHSLESHTYVEDVTESAEFQFICYPPLQAGQQRVIHPQSPPSPSLEEKRNHGVEPTDRKSVV